MEFSFGIITSPQTCEFIQKIVDSIVFENIPKYEIIIVGGEDYYKHENLTVIPFDDSIKSMWITKKKNLITGVAKFENIVYLHDYIQIDRNWYNGFLKFGNNFDVCMTQIKNTDGSRFRDWTLCHEDIILPNAEYLIPYNMTHLNKLMYISGAYWVAKKKFMEKYPLDEVLCWGQSEDIVWSRHIRNNINFSMNVDSSVSLLKWKSPAFNISSENTINMLNNIKL